MKVKILKDTPFDKAGTSITMEMFRLHYPYFHQKSCTDEEIANHIRSWHQLGHPRHEWFEMDEVGIPLPLEFIHNGLLYTKQLDGLYHQFILGSVMTGETSIAMLTEPDAARLFVLNSPHKKLVWYCTDDVRRKL